MEKNDFFFGKYYIDDYALLSLYKLEALTKKVEPAFFTRQLNRFVAQHGGYVRVTDGTSHPSFWPFIDCIEPSSVGFIEIYARTDINNAVKATLACDIVLDSGVVSVLPHWCAYKDIRADEIVSTLLVPLHLKGLHVRTFLRWEDGETERLTSGMDWGAEEELKAVFNLAKYPSAAITLCDDDHRRFQKNVRDLRLASQVGDENLNGEAALDALCKLRNMPVFDNAHVEQ